MNPGIELTPEGALLFQLYTRLVGEGLHPEEAYDDAIKALEYWALRTDAPAVVCADPGERAAQLEQAAWERFRKVKATAEMLLADRPARPEYNAQLSVSIEEAERAWLGFGTFRLREALGQYRREGAV
jgi:hypothetical protein